MRAHQESRIEALIRRRAGKAIGDHNLIKDKDRILVALSGGKDSWTLLHILGIFQKRAPISFEIVPVTVDPGYPGFKADLLKRRLAKKGMSLHIEKTNNYDIIQEKAKKGRDGRIRGGDFCAFCSRLRRGILYRLARDRGCTKIALGHHADDVIETLLLNQFFEGRTETMLPKFVSEDGLNTVIRPLYYVWEDETMAYAKEKKVPIIFCQCPVCEDKGMQRKMVKALLFKLERKHPGIKTSILSASEHFHGTVQAPGLSPIYKEVG